MLALLYVECSKNIRYVLGDTFVEFQYTVIEMFHYIPLVLAESTCVLYMIHGCSNYMDLIPLCTYQSIISLTSWKQEVYDILMLFTCYCCNIFPKLLPLLKIETWRCTVEKYCEGIIIILMTEKILKYWCSEVAFS